VRPAHSLSAVEFFGVVLIQPVVIVGRMRPVADESFHDAVIDVGTVLYAQRSQGRRLSLLESATPVAPLVPHRAT
jgi:hypothetical protein